MGYFLLLAALYASILILRTQDGCLGSRNIKKQRPLVELLPVRLTISTPISTHCAAMTHRMIPRTTRDLERESTEMYESSVRYLGIYLAQVPQRDATEP